MKAAVYFDMISQNRLLTQENASLSDENTRLACSIESAEQRVKALSSILQKCHVNVMPAIAVCNGLTFASLPKDPTVLPSWFSRAGQVQLPSPAMALADGPFLAAGETNGPISLLSIVKHRLHGFYRFPSDASTPRSLSVARESLQGHTSSVLSLRWDANNCLSSASLDSTLRIWDIDRSCAASTFDLGMPIVSHAALEASMIAATCTRRLISVDPRDPDPVSIAADSVITSANLTRFGLLLGTTAGEVLLFDTRINKAYQSLLISPTHLAVSKISGAENVTVTAFDGGIRLLGDELPLFVEREFWHAPINGSIIGSCALPMISRDDFIISGSTNGNAIVWSSFGGLATLQHRGQLVYDCARIEAFVAAFATCDSSGFVTMWARSFDPAA
jgi:WD40 repeat protein